MRARIWLRAWAVALGLFASQGVARAQPPLDFALEIDAPAQAHCTAALELRGAIEERIDRIVFLDQPAPSRRIRVSIAHAAATDGWSAQITMYDEQAEVVGERRITTLLGRCSALDEALIVVIGTLIGIADPQPARTQARSPQRQAPKPEPDTPPNSTAVQALRAQRPRAETRITGNDSAATHLALLGSAGGRAELGWLPGVGVGGALSVGLDAGAWFVAIGATLLPYATQALARGATARFLSVVGDVQLCWQPLPHGRPQLTAALALCASAQAGEIAVSTLGLDANTSHLTPIVRGLFGLRLTVPIQERYGICAGIAGVVPLVASHFYYLDAAGARTYYHSLSFGLSAQLGMYWTFFS